MEQYSREKKLCYMYWARLMNCEDCMWEKYAINVNIQQQNAWVTAVIDCANCVCQTCLPCYYFQEMSSNHPLTEIRKWKILIQ
jgi:hypothetical protein